MWLLFPFCLLFPFSFLSPGMLQMLLEATMTKMTTAGSNNDNALLPHPHILFLKQP